MIQNKTHGNCFDTMMPASGRGRYFYTHMMWWILLEAVLIASAAGCAVWADSGPLETSNRFPLHLMFLKPRPVNADLPVPGEFRTSMAVEYSNTYFQQKNDRWDVLMDLEMTTVEFSMIYGVTSRVAVRMDVPFVSMGDGFLDGFLENYHDTLGVSNYGREKRPKNTFAYSVSKNGQLWVRGEEGTLQVADAVVSAQVGLLRKAVGDRKTTGSLVLRLKLPTGDKSRGLGSGRFDSGVYMPVRWSSSPWSLFMMPGVAFIADPETDGAAVAARNSYCAYLGLAYDYSPQTTWVAQLNYYSSPIEETGIDELDRGALELAIGFHYLLTERWRAEFAFCEDLTPALPDFNVRLALRWTWRHPQKDR